MLVLLQTAIPADGTVVEEGFSKNGRILQDPSLRCQSGERCKNFRRISDGEKIRIYSHEIPE